MGSMSECTTSIVVCLYIGCVGVSVFMATQDIKRGWECVIVIACFFVSLGLGLLPLLDQFRPPLNVGPIPSPPHYLSVVGISARQCTGSLPLAACWGLDP
ncbi:hypothetical protein ILYODFUR_020801 [Ilyodon furcidens]|uniref:Uncharacterized protein n=1 Tax=Ilyodon furcidens TaxID=33524 RepID=A0ABV0UW21_9TELE